MKIIRYALIIVLIVAVVTGAIFAVSYINRNKLLWSATGSKDKAILNATWRMSPQEVSRTNNGYFTEKYDTNPVRLPAVMDTRRVRVLEQGGVSLWGYHATLRYYFFDEMLYRYDVFYVSEKGEQDIIHALSQRFGQATQSDNSDRDGFDRLPGQRQWTTDKQTLSLFTVEEVNGPTHIYLLAQYKPLIRKIKEIVESEQQEYF